MDDALPANSRVLLVSPYWLSAGDIHANITAKEKWGKKREGKERRGKERMRRRTKEE